MLPDVQAALDWAVEALATSDTARLDSECLLADCVRQSRTWLFTWPDKILKDEQWRCFQQLVERRKAGEPVAYLLGYREFWGLTLKVSPDTLIPRPDTEDLVAKVLELIPLTEAKVADLGTGTGAIALALAAERPDWRITACDFNPGAVALAEANRKALGFEQVTVLQSDWCQALETDAVARGGFDLIVSNPPYIEDDDPHLSQGDVRFEPLSALTSGADGLDDIRLITLQAKVCLKPGGWLIFEHGYNQAGAVRGILSAAGYQDVQTAQDLAGVDRMSFAQRP
ncbi:peptide chain release factor N(5)-glutamine methyltransferase [Oceanospirillum linum]|uniref:Release factor glutamine methyltransferase n=1 Tax=Oceanospirillum linum TaxID=966 RepID=A0A1T1H9B1_OCELI|nr:peptide chain release factor N(5)-glutamine methyltransferase [Oceanospirillum linum]OOV86454.1 protein-(glutamine-N5) methyltransferase, release factor-specific [Oceanospirillum linum]SEG33839.1 [protein release factor]-glutamine N5-methyltransferase [Oleiphilus messinensis]SMP29416.1 [protein release factor]-glutamine N5-methyltransferase [Oceanospirillum linum]